MSIDRNEAVSRFEKQFGAKPAIGARAPGRVNIIGEHTDYNHGFVLPMAIERETLILARPLETPLIRAYAANLERTAEAPLDRFERNPQEPWLDYIVGVARELDFLHKPLQGAEIMILGDVPVGCGLSSSASLEMATLCLFETLGGFTLDGPEAARLGQRVENNFLGVSTGIMDQFISRMGKAGHVLFLDCRTIDYDLVPVSFENACFVIANTGVARGLAASKYNERVAQCREAVEGMAHNLDKPGTHLRDFTRDDLETAREHLSDVTYRRARHVISEDARTKAACDAMRAGDAPKLGRLMNASDESLRMDYEVTCPELDTMTRIARDIKSCFGSRMTGAGFGGCTVSLVVNSEVSSFAGALSRGYYARTGPRENLIISGAADGAGSFLL